MTAKTQTFNQDQLVRIAVEKAMKFLRDMELNRVGETLLPGWPFIKKGFVNGFRNGFVLGLKMGTLLKKGDPSEVKETVAPEEAVEPDPNQMELPLNELP